MPEKQIRILIADDHALFRHGLVSMLENNPEIFIIGEAENGEELVNKYFKLKPDIIVADISMPVITGIEAIQKIRSKDKSVKALFLSMHEGEEYIYYCLKSGGRGLINKNVEKGELLYAIKKVENGDRYFGNEWREKDIENLIKKFEELSRVKQDGSDDNLSPREKQILLYISEGLTSSEIADKLLISKRTVDTHRTNLIQKLGLKSLPELIKYAINYSVSHKKSS